MEELVSQNFTLTEQNTVLVEQIRNFEKQSFEIQAKIKRGIEVETENQENDAKISNFKDTERGFHTQISTLNQ
jgi:hypothetical protein